MKLTLEICPDSPLTPREDKMLAAILSCIEYGDVAKTPLEAEDPPPKAKPKAKPKAAPKPKPAPEPEVAEEEEEDEPARQYEYQDIRKMCVAAAQRLDDKGGDGSEQVRNLLESYKVKHLNKLPLDKYAEFAKKVEAL